MGGHLQSHAKGICHPGRHWQRAARLSAFPAHARHLCGRLGIEEGDYRGDVRKDTRYLPTFHTTRSEIIIPIVNEQKQVVGMLDAESEKTDAFRTEDRQFSSAAEGSPLRTA